MLRAFKPPTKSPILEDSIIELSGAQAHQKCTHPLRRIVVWDEEGQREFVLPTNHLKFGATTLSKVYKERWQIELFFKALKQNLKIKGFVGTSQNALLIQIWTALIVLLLLQWLHHLRKAEWSLSVLAALLRLNQFTYRDLCGWLDEPYHTPRRYPEPEQLVLAFFVILDRPETPARRTPGVWTRKTALGGKNEAKSREKQPITNEEDNRLGQQLPGIIHAVWVVVSVNPKQGHPFGNYQYFYTRQLNRIV